MRLRKDGLFAASLSASSNALGGSIRNGQPAETGRSPVGSVTGGTDPRSNAPILRARLRYSKPLGGRVCASLADDPRIRAGMHRLPRLEVNVDLSLRLLGARCAGHGDVKGRLTHLPHATFSRFKKVREVAQQNRVRYSYPHGRKNAWCGYRHISSFPADQDEVTPDLFRQTLLGTKGCSSLISVKFEAFRTSIRVPKEAIRPRKGSASGRGAPPRFDASPA